ncbi:unnamed protein product [Pylaiella littoralis]
MKGLEAALTRATVDNLRCPYRKSCHNCSCILPAELAFGMHYIIVTPVLCKWNSTSLLRLHPSSRFCTSWICSGIFGKWDGRWRLPEFTAVYHISRFLFSP